MIYRNSSTIILSIAQGFCAASVQPFGRFGRLSTVLRCAARLKRLFERLATYKPLLTTNARALFSKIAAMRQVKSNTNF